MTSITYPPEMLPVADGPADVIVVNDDGSQRVVLSNDVERPVVTLLQFCTEAVRASIENPNADVGHRHRAITALSRWADRGNPFANAGLRPTRH